MNLDPDVINLDGDKAICPNCRGKGEYEPNWNTNQLVICPDCKGKGYVEIVNVLDGRPKGESWAQKMVRGGR